LPEGCSVFFNYLPCHICFVGVSGLHVRTDLPRQRKIEEKSGDPLIVKEEKLRRSKWLEKKTRHLNCTIANTWGTKINKIYVQWKFTTARLLFQKNFLSFKDHEK